MTIKYSLRLYHRINSYNQRYDEFNKLYPEFNPNCYNKKEVQELYNALCNIFSVYVHALRDILKVHGIYEYFPIDIIKKSKQLELVYDNLDYKLIIRTANVIKRLGNTNNELICELQKNVLSKIEDNFDILKDEFNQIQKMCIKPKRIRLFGLPKDTPCYNESVLNIEEDDYLTILNYFKNNQEIKTVWAFGSRIEGNYRDSSDIDLLIDSPLQGFDKIVYDLHNLPVPYPIDAKNLHDKNKKAFVNSTAREHKVKTIYRKYDFKKRGLF